MDLLFTHAPAVESLRQWLVLLGCWLLIGLFALADYRLYRTHRQITFDQVVLAVEAVKVFVFFFYEFAVDHMIVLLVVFLIQSAVRAVVCANFFQKSLTIIRKQHWVRRFVLLYYSAIGGMIALILVLALLSENQINCMDVIFSKHPAPLTFVGYHWFLLDAVDFAQSVLIILSAVFIVKHMKHSMREQTL